MTVRSSSRIGMPIGKIYDLLSVLSVNTNSSPVHRSPPENTQWSFYRNIADSRPSSGLFEYGPLRDRLETQLGLFEYGPLRNRLEAFWCYGKRALPEPNQVLVSRGPGERLGPFLGLHYSSLLGLGNEALSQSPLKKATMHLCL